MYFFLHLLSFVPACRDATLLRAESSRLARNSAIRCKEASFPLNRLPFPHGHDGISPSCLSGDAVTKRRTYPPRCLLSRPHGLSPPPLFRSFSPLSFCLSLSLSLPLSRLYLRWASALGSPVLKCKCFQKFARKYLCKWTIG